MKKKFVLTLALVLMVAVSLTAAPLEIGGEFKAGYDVAFKSAGNTIAARKAGMDLSLGAFSVAGDFWKVELGEMALTTGDNNMKATASIYLDKALAAQGMDMGDLTMTMTIGNKGDLGDLSVYSNKRDDLQGLKMKSDFAGAYATSMTVGYGKLVTVMVGADPVSFVEQKIAAVPAKWIIDQTTGINTLVPATPVVTVAAKNAFVISAKSTPVDGVSVGLAYTNVSNNLKATNTSADGAFAASVNVDVAALAGLDFGLGVSAYDLYNFATDKNNLYLELNGSYADFSAWTEYRILDKTNDMKLEVAYAGIENVGLSAFVELGDITKQAAADEVTVKIGGGVNYKMGGVTYALDADYAVQAKTFTMSPTVKISF